jgi:uncharacterized protein (TIGR00730 family)
MGDRRRAANGHHRPAPARAPSRQRNNKKPEAAASHQIRSICVYCGSNPGRDPSYVEAARELGQRMAKAGIGLVYGGGGLGLMGEIARAVLAGGGRVTGIIPSFLSEREQMLRDVTELTVVTDMHERKRLMFERSDAFVAMPGGIGTLEELVEQLTWAQLGRHSKPIVLLNIGGFWAPFTALLDHMRREAFIRNSMEVSFRVADSPVAVLEAVLTAPAPTRPLADAAVAERF